LPWTVQEQSRKAETQNTDHADTIVLGIGMELELELLLASACLAAALDLKLVLAHLDLKLTCSPNGALTTSKMNARKQRAEGSGMGDSAGSYDTTLSGLGLR
jgi:hypothetical protein